MNETVKTAAPFWEGGSIRLHHADCLDLLDALPGGSFDCVATDPPYCSLTKSAPSRKPSGLKYLSSDRRAGCAARLPGFDGEDRGSFSHMRFVKGVFHALRRACAEDATCFWMTDWRQLAMVVDVAEGAGWGHCGLVPWDKTPGARPIAGWFRNQCEHVLCFKRGAGCATRMDAYAHGLFRQAAPQAARRLHQVEKPVGLMEMLLGVLAPGSRVLDPFAGSGTTGVAARRLGLPCVLVESMREYCEIAAKRLEEGGE